MVPPLLMKLIILSGFFSHDSSLRSNISREALGRLTLAFRLLPGTQDLLASSSRIQYPFQFVAPPQGDRTQQGIASFRRGLMVQRVALSLRQGSFSTPQGGIWLSCKEGINSSYFNNNGKYGHPKVILAKPGPNAGSPSRVLCRSGIFPFYR